MKMGGIEVPWKESLMVKKKKKSNAESLLSLRRKIIQGFLRQTMLLLDKSKW